MSFRGKMFRPSDCKINESVLLICTRSEKNKGDFRKIKPLICSI